MSPCRPISWVRAPGRPLPRLDGYAYRDGDRVIGSGQPAIEWAATGTVPPACVTRCAVGLDLNPLDVTDYAEVAWLDAYLGCCSLIKQRRTGPWGGPPCLSPSLDSGVGRVG